MKAVVLASYNATFVISSHRQPAPGETVRVNYMRVEHGGKGSNQAIGIRRMGFETKVIASVGNDAFGELAMKKWIAEGIDVSWVKTASTYTGYAFVLLTEDGGNSIYISPNANEAIDGELVAGKLVNASYDLFVTVFEINPKLALNAAKAASKKSMVVLNPAPAIPLSPEDLDNIYAVTPNETEIKVMSGIKPDSPADIPSLARSYSKHAKVVAVTLGERGAFVISGNREMLVPALHVKAVDTTGAGDAWNAAFSTFLAEGNDPFYSAEMANRAAAFLVSRKAGVPDLVDNMPYRDEI
ncbi:MAG: ribokinase [Nitrososphaerota archaeon]|jgi:ribokinase|nr:ribokinase [Nitrososphaerota archaeon]MDG6930797.1 ribokinase [Nitrososphaerota archaeon]MDG6932953.1 ribokinase [Nitrososphaerota archaeon]MDG6936455.1 ribokinase [Nitrososphaerota archaeon]MDG6944702.1 ribokinase [Nitrososphaerota archaeon]